MSRAHAVQLTSLAYGPRNCSKDRWWAGFSPVSSGYAGCRLGGWRSEIFSIPFPAHCVSVTIRGSSGSFLSVLFAHRPCILVPKRREAPPFPGSGQDRSAAQAPLAAAPHRNPRVRQAPPHVFGRARELCLPGVQLHRSSTAFFLTKWVNRTPLTTLLSCCEIGPK